MSVSAFQLVIQNNKLSLIRSFQKVYKYIINNNDSLAWITLYCKKMSYTTTFIPSFNLLSSTIKIFHAKNYDKICCVQLKDNIELPIMINLPIRLMNIDVHT